MGRPKKYHTEEERQAAKKQWAANARRKRRTGTTSNASLGDIMSSAAGVLSQAVQSTSPRSQNSKEQRSEQSESYETLPPVDIPISTNEPDTDAERQEEAATTETPSSSSPNSDATAKDATQSSERSSSSSKKTADDVNGEQIAQLVAAMWVEGLKIGSAFAASEGYMGLGEPFLTMNHQAALILSRKALEDSSMNPEEFAALVCCGSGAWVGWNGYKAWEAKKAKAKAEAKMKGLIIDVPSAGPQSGKQESPKSTPKREEPSKVNGAVSVSPGPIGEDGKPKPRPGGYL